ncbi:unnamed protein product [Closterium sp. Naga37s-1]|nr:unnamed protein product [Closterium sp. Naga37s-1]
MLTRFDFRFVQKLTQSLGQREVGSGLYDFLTTFGKYFDKGVGGDDAGEGEELDNLEQHGPAAEDTGAPPVIDAEIVALGALVADGARIDLVNARQSDTDGEPPVPRENAREILRGMRETQQRAAQEETQRCGSETLQQKEEGERMEEELAGALQAVHLRVENDEHEEGQGLEMRQGSLNVVGELEEEVQMAERDNTVVYQRREARTKKRERTSLEKERRVELEKEEARQREEEESKRLEEPVEREKEEKRQREEEEGKREEDRRAEREKEEKRQREEEEGKREEDRRAEREKEEKRQREEEEGKREEDRRAEREKEEKRQREEEEGKREEDRRAEREKEEKRQREEEEGKREEDRRAEREKEEKRQREEEEGKREEDRRAEREKEEKRQREEEEGKREEDRRAEREKEEKREGGEGEGGAGAGRGSRTRGERRAKRRRGRRRSGRGKRVEDEGREAREEEAREKEERAREEGRGRGARGGNERQREVAGLGEQGAGGQRRGDGTRHTCEGQKGVRVCQTQAGRGAGEGARQVLVGDQPAEAQQGTTVRRAVEVGLAGLGTGGQMEEVGEHHGPECQRDRREEHERREMGGAPQRNERQREVAGLGEQGAGGQRRGDGTCHTSEGQRGTRVFQTQAGRGAGEGARQVLVGDQPTDAQQGTTVRRAVEVGLAGLGTGGPRLVIQREGGRRDDQTARNRVGEEDRMGVEQSRQAGRREGEARRTLHGERMAEEQVWRGVGWGVGGARQRENQQRQAGGRVEEELESAASALPMQRRHPRAAENPAAVFEETEGGFEEAGDRIAASGRVHTTPELMRRLTLVARTVARISSEQTVRFSDCMAEIRQFGSQMQGWDLRYLQDYDDLTHEYHVLKDSVVRERDELVQLRTALSTATAEARAAAADAGRAAAAAVVGTLEETFAGFFDTVAERLKGMVEQAMEAASKGGKLEATMAPESVNHIEKAFEDSVYTVWVDLKTSDDANKQTFKALQKALAGLANEEGEAGAGVADLDLSGPVSTNWRASLAAKELQREKEKESAERKAAEVRKRTAIQRTQATIAEKTRARIVGSSERAAGNRAADTAAEPRWTREELAAAFEKRRKEDEQAKEAERAERAAQKKRKAEDEKRVREEQAKEAERAERAAQEKRKADEVKRVREEQAKEAERAERAAQEKRKADEEKRVREEQAKEAERAERAAEEKRKADEEKRVREEQAKEAERAERAAEEKRKKEEEDKRLREEQTKALKVAEEKRAEALKRQMELQAERERMHAQMEKLAKLEEVAKEEMERQQEELEAQKKKMEKKRQQIAATDVEGVAGQGQGGDAILSVVPTADPRQPLEVVDLAEDVESIDLTVQADSES